MNDDNWGRRRSGFNARVPGGCAYHVVMLRSRDDDIVEKIMCQLELMSGCMLLENQCHEELGR